MLTAEKMHLVLTDEDGRPLVPAHHSVALAAAALADLRQAGVVELEEQAGVDRARVTVVAAGTTDHPVLDALLTEADALSGKRVAAVVGKGRPRARKPVVAHLTETGELEEHKALLNTRHVPTSPAARQQILDRLSRALTEGGEPSDEDLLLLGVLHHLNVARHLLPQAREEEASRREFTRRLERLTRDDLLVQSVGRAVGLAAATAAATAVRHG